MEVYAQPDIDLTTVSLRADAGLGWNSEQFENKENVAPCGTPSNLQGHPSEGFEGKSHVMTRSILADVTHNFPGDSTPVLVEPESTQEIQILKSRPQGPEELAKNVTAAASKLRRMR